MKFLFKRTAFLFFVLAFASGAGIAAFEQSIPIVLVSPPTIANILVTETSPQNLEIRVQFTKPVQRQKALPTIRPEILGEWTFEDPVFANHLFTTLVFSSVASYEPDADYTFTISGIQGFGLQKRPAKGAPFVFHTAPEPKTSESKAPQAEGVVLLPIALDWQDSPLSCEAASLKMALAHEGIFVPEDQIMQAVGWSVPRDRENGVWGDPHQGFVGDINGKMCTTGFGVFWEPLARAAAQWKEARVITRGTIQDITREVDNGHAVVAWGSLPVLKLTDCSWKTVQGEPIRAFKETHVRLVVGYMGDSQNPTHIILNDPLAGRLYWSTSVFLANWDTYERSGVVLE